MKTNITTKLLNALKVSSLALILSFGVSYALAWTAPSLPPPTGNVSAPLNTGNTAQTRTGPITLADTTTGTLVAGGLGLITNSITTNGITFGDNSVMTTAPLNGLGYNQNWTSFTVPSQRSFGSTQANSPVYTNSTGKPITVALSHTDWVNVYVNGVYVAHDQGGNANTWTTTTFIVPTGATYSVASDVIQMWVELR